jgi:serine palmitoyltransferase
VLHENEYENADGLTYPKNPPTSEQVFTTVHTEFGHCGNDQYRYTSQYNPEHPVRGIVEQDPPYYILLTTYVSYIILIAFGHLRDFLGKRFKRAAYKHLLSDGVGRCLVYSACFNSTHCAFSHRATLR